jgi:beta propeller repeat protein
LPSCSGPVAVEFLRKHHLFSEREIVKMQKESQDGIRNMKRDKIWPSLFVIGALLCCCSCLPGCKHEEPDYLPAPTAVHGIEEFPLCLHVARQWQPAISGNIVVWTDDRNEENAEATSTTRNEDVYGHDLSTGEEFMVAGEPCREREVAVSESAIVWLAEPAQGSPSIRGYNLTEENEFLIYEGEDCDGWGGQPGLSGNLVAFRAGTYGNWYIWGYDLSTGTKSPITKMEVYSFKPPPDHPSIGGHILAWEDDRLDQQGPFDIWGYDLSTGTEFPICTNPESQGEPAVSNNNIVVWEDERNGNTDIYGFDPVTGNEFSICTEPFNQSGPEISGSIVIWQDFRHGNWDIYGFDLATGSEFPICVDPADQSNPAISGNVVVWQDFRHGNWDVYGAKLSP